MADTARRDDAVEGAVPGRHDHTHGRDARDETRARIIDAALELIADHGFAATSTREISERLGFTKAALYYHFRTKDDLLAAIIEPAMADLLELVANASPDPSAAERRHVIEGYVDVVAAHADLIKVLANDPAIRKCQVLATSRPVYERLEQILAADANPDARQRTRVRAAMGAVHVALLRAETDEERATAPDVAYHAACAVLGLPTGARRHNVGGDPPGDPAVTAGSAAGGPR